MNVITQLTEISNTAYVSWKKGELEKAEEILSSDIEHSSSHLHYHRANRSFVRSRLQHWDRALDDANEVNRIIIPTAMLTNLEHLKVASCPAIARCSSCKECCVVWSEEI